MSRGNGKGRRARARGARRRVGFRKEHTWKVRAWTWLCPAPTPWDVPALQGDTPVWGLLPRARGPSTRPWWELTPDETEGTLDTFGCQEASQRGSAGPWVPCVPLGPLAPQVRRFIRQPCTEHLLLCVMTHVCTWDAHTCVFVIPPSGRL